MLNTLLKGKGQYLFANKNQKFNISIKVFFSKIVTKNWKKSFL